MLKITLRLPRHQKEFIHYSGDADKYLNLPIVIDEKAVGVITKIIEDTDEYTEAEGILYKAGYNLIKNEDLFVPSDVEIINSRKTLDDLIESIDISEPKEMREVKEENFENNYMSKLLKRYGRNKRKELK